MASNVPESAASASSARLFTRRSGWSAGTRSPGERRLNIVPCWVVFPRMAPPGRGGDHGLLWVVDARADFVNSLLGSADLATLKLLVKDNADHVLGADRILITNRNGTFIFETPFK